MFPVPAIALEVCGNLIRLILAELEFLSHIRVENAHERAADRRLLWIVVGSFANQVVSWPRETRVEAARSQPTVALQFLHELKKLHTQIRFYEVIFAEPRKAGQFLCDRRFFFR